MLQRPDYGRLPWWWIAASALLSLIGIAFVLSATQEAAVGASWMTRDGAAQAVWWLVGGIGGAMAVHVAPLTWRRYAFPLCLAGLVVMVAMQLLAGTALVPRIKGQANWIVLGGFRLQPVELVKLATLLACATLTDGPNFQAKRLSHCLLLLLVAGIPSLVIAREDLGSALTFMPMALGILLVAGMRLRHFSLAILAVVLIGCAAYALLPRDGPKAYQWRRIDAWVYPERYALAEAYQTDRSKRSIGSGQWTGKGYMQGEQNRLGWVPEKHTDLIFAVVGEEVGFIGSAGFVLLIIAWCAAGLVAAARASTAWGRHFIGGFVCLIAGQAAINLAVALGMMPVTGVTLPFVSYGGSSLIACWIGLGIACSAAASNET